MPLLNRNGVRLHFAVHGRGPAVLLTHGFGATAQMWGPQIEPLAQNHRLILWDMRGHGQSDSPPDDAAYSEAATVADMIALLDHVGVAAAVVGGLSLGGYMSLAFHCQHPQRVAALLVIDTGPGYKREAARAAWNRQALAMANDLQANGGAALSSGSAERAGATHKDLHGLVRAGRHMLTQHSSRVIASLPRIAAPTLVLAGAEDAPFLAATDYMAAKIPGAQKIIIPNAGHAVNLDQPGAFNEAVLSFLRRHDL